MGSRSAAQFLLESLPEHPTVMRMAMELGVSTGQIAGSLIRLWGLFRSRASEDGILIGYDLVTLNEYLQVPGFTDALPDEWKVEDYCDGIGTKMPNYVSCCFITRRANSGCPTPSNPFPPNANLPENLNNETALKAFSDWIAHKQRTKKNYKSKESALREFRRWADKGPGRLANAIALSIRRDWAGIYEESRDSGGSARVRSSNGVEDPEFQDCRCSEGSEQPAEPERFDPWSEG